MPLKRLRESAPSVSVGEQRKEAGWRALYGALFWLVTLIVGPFLAAFYIAWMLVDILYQALTNNEGLSAGGYGTEIFDRTTKLREYTVFGRGDRNDWRR